MGILLYKKIKKASLPFPKRRKRRNLKKGLTKRFVRAIIEKQHGRRYAGMAELADARDLKSREIYFSYRFDPGFRHHFPRSICQISYFNQFHIAELSSLVARWVRSSKQLSVVLDERSPPNKEQRSKLTLCALRLCEWTGAKR